jgi:hypothetical protein
MLLVQALKRLLGQQLLTQQLPQLPNRVRGVVRFSLIFLLESGMMVVCEIFQLRSLSFQNDAPLPL